MHYLFLRRSQIILASFAIASLLLAVFPTVDIHISRIFFQGTFPDRWWQKLLHEYVGLFLTLSLLAILALYACNRLSKRNVCCVDGRKVVYLFLVVILGAGLIVNVGLKDHFGRARPRDIEEFGGAKQFTAAFVVSHECARNC